MVPSQRLSDIAMDRKGIDTSVARQQPKLLIGTTGVHTNLKSGVRASVEIDCSGRSGRTGQALWHDGAARYFDEASSNFLLPQSTLSAPAMKSANRISNCFFLFNGSDSKSRSRAISNGQ